MKEADKDIVIAAFTKDLAMKAWCRVNDCGRSRAQTNSEIGKVVDELNLPPSLHSEIYSMALNSLR